MIKLLILLGVGLFLADYKFSHGSIYEKIVLTNFRNDTLININE